MAQASLLRNVGAVRQKFRQDLQPRDDVGSFARRESAQLLQDAINAKANVEADVGRQQVHIAGANVRLAVSSCSTKCVA